MVRMSVVGLVLTSAQAADRRDRLIYVLSQINAARGDDGMQMEVESDSESEEEVRITVLPSQTPLTLIHLAGGRVLLPRIAGVA